MRLVVADREVVDPDRPDPARDDEPRAAPVEPQEVAGELLLVPELGVPGLEENALRARRDVDRLEVGLPDGVTGDRRPVDDDRRPAERVQGHALHPRGAFDEVHRRVHVRSGVHPQRELAHVGVTSLGDRRCALELDVRVARVHGHVRADRDRDVVDGHDAQFDGETRTAARRRPFSLTSGRLTCPCRCSSTSRPASGTPAPGTRPRRTRASS